MKSILLIAALGLAFTNKSLSGPNKWFSANRVFPYFLGYGYIIGTSPITTNDFDENPPLPGQPQIMLDVDIGQCLQNTERICAALFTTDASGNLPVTFANAVVLGEFRYE